MYRRPKFLEILLEIREEMAREADHDVDLFAEMARTGYRPIRKKVETDRSNSRNRDVGTVETPKLMPSRRR